ncbi:MAG: MBOAT family O-acyltransferase [Selenomonadaceae bacterium]
MSGYDFSFIHLELPIGISFFTFQCMSYLFDVYREKVEAQKKFVIVALYVSLFPQLIAGPIVRYSDIEKELVNRAVTINDFSDGMLRFIYGLSKKILVANYMAQIADGIFDMEAGEISVALSWLGAVAYTLQIYFDFSGYSDMAIGLGRMLGFHFPENFNYPYIARSVTDFWRRWHMTLTGWFRDYVYIPLGGNRVALPRWILNMAVVWTLTGIWHGANWTFMMWGLIYFVLQIIEKLTGFTKHLGPLAHVYTLVIVSMAWVIFRSPDISYGVSYICTMLGLTNAQLDQPIFWLYLDSAKIIVPIAMILSTPIYPWLLNKLTPHPVAADKVEALIALVLFVFAYAGVFGASWNPFIYFNF